LFARYANFTLGGGSATTAVLHHELVGKRRWITDHHFILCFALGRLTPGTNLLAFCTGVGWLLPGMAGAVAALMSASIPCAIMVIRRRDLEAAGECWHVHYGDVRVGTIAKRIGPADRARSRQKATSQNKPDHRTLPGYWCSSIRHHHWHQHHHPPSQMP
jgi:Chromate transporter